MASFTASFVLQFLQLGLLFWVSSLIKHFRGTSWSQTTHNTNYTTLVTTHFHVHSHAIILLQSCSISHLDFHTSILTGLCFCLFSKLTSHCLKNNLISTSLHVSSSPPLQPTVLVISLRRAAHECSMPGQQVIHSLTYSTNMDLTSGCCIFGMLRKQMWVYMTFGLKNLKEISV